MSADEATKTADTQEIITPVDALKNLLTNLEDSKKNTIWAMTIVRKSIKDFEKMQRDLDKMQNKKARRQKQVDADGNVIRKEPSGITKPCALSSELSGFLEVEPDTLLARTEVTKRITTYVKEHELQDPANRRQFNLKQGPWGKKLADLLGTDELSYFNLQTYLKKHFPKPEVVVPPTQETWEQKADDTPTTPTATVTKKKIVKKIIKKKRPVSELSEEA